jgi:hypothetical protein
MLELYHILPEKPCQSSPYGYFAFAKILPYNDLSPSAAGERLNKFKEKNTANYMAANEANVILKVANKRLRLWRVRF